MPCLTCGEKKIWCTIRKSKNIVTMIVETHVKLCMIEQAGFSRKKFFCPQSYQNGPKTGLFEFIEKFGHQFLLNLFYSENFY